MKKEKARSHISAYLEKHIKELRIELEDKIKSSVLQCSDVNDIDSHSHQFQVLKDEKSVRDRLNSAIKEQVYFQNTPLRKATKVQEGALIEVKNFYIYIGVVTPIISTEEKDIIGISIAAPIYKELVNQKVGFKFKFNGNDCFIESIL